MFVVKINAVDISSHTQECDAITQKSLFIANGISENQITIVQQDSFNPVEE